MAIARRANSGLLSPVINFSAERARMNTQLFRTVAAIVVLAAPILSLAQTAPTASPVITLLNKDQAICNLPVPGEGSGETLQYELAAMNSPCKGMNNAVRAIKISSMPSAVQILLTDDPTCSKATDDIPDIEDPSRRFWFQLRTKEKLSDPEEMQMTFFTMHNPNTIIKKGLVLVDKYQKNNANDVLDKLSCVKVITSPAKIPTPAAPVTLTPGQWVGIPEPDSTFKCPTNQVLLGRAHMGDENKTTRYLCGTALQAGKVLTVQNIQMSDPQQENNSYFVCGLNAVMTGRKHDGDEEGDTRHWCGELADGAGVVLKIAPDEWGSQVIEDDHTFTCPENKVLIGRTHRGDEKGKTRYRCGTPYGQPTQRP